MEREKLSVFVGTWNVGNAPPPADLSPWIPRDACDIYAIGVQECQYEQRPPYESCEDDWFSTIRSHLGGDYEPLECFSITPMTVDTYKNPEDFMKAVESGKARSGEIRLGVFVRRSIAHKVSATQKALRTTGRLNGLSGNKGGLCVYFRYGEATFVFINAHLNAHAENLERRNQDVVSINSGLRVGHTEFDAVTQSTFAFWFGDLNYRLDFEDVELSNRLLANADASGLCAYDQLKREQDGGRAFQGFSEGEIKFLPTFKVKKGKGTYDPQRVPSYCDRVMYRAHPGCGISIRSYTSAPGVLTSDHMPVSATFDVEPIYRIPTGFAASGVTAAITFSGLRVHKLQPSSKHFVTDSTCQPVLKAAVITSTSTSEGDIKSPAVDWSWTDSLRIAVLSSNVDYVRESHVLIAMRDSKRPRNLLGEGVVSLAGVDSTPKEFEVQLRQFGLPIAVLCGTVRLDEE
eukprot:Opistho-2@62135